MTATATPNTSAQFIERRARCREHATRCRDIADRDVLRRDFFLGLATRYDALASWNADLAAEAFRDELDDALEEYRPSPA